jgi:hypothetical protein
MDEDLWQFALKAFVTLFVPWIRSELLPVSSP